MFVMNVTKMLLIVSIILCKDLNWQIRQGGSVMCVRTLKSDPAHLFFSLNCLPNEEEIKKN